MNEPRVVIPNPRRQIFREATPRCVAHRVHAYFFRDRLTRAEPRVARPQGERKEEWMAKAALERPVHGRTIEDDDEYMRLVAEFPLVPIKDDKALVHATRVAESLLDRESLTEDARNYLEVLTSLIDVYEAKHHRIGSPGDSAVLKHLMEARGVRAIDLHRATEIAESTISSVLKGDRELTRQHIEKLAGFFAVPCSVFLGQARPSEAP